jgi:hypothetical protein
MEKRNEQMNALIRGPQRQTPRLISEGGKGKIVARETTGSDDGANDEDATNAAHERHEEDKS